MLSTFTCSIDIVEGQHRVEFQFDRCEDLLVSAELSPLSQHRVEFQSIVARGYRLKSAVIRERQAETRARFRIAVNIMIIGDTQR